MLLDHKVKWYPGSKAPCDLKETNQIQLQKVEKEKESKTETLKEAGLGV